jgi:hypothetical protein
MPDYVFREFMKQARTGKSKGPAVRILRSGAFSLNPEALEMLGDPAHVVLLHDESGRALAFRAAKQAERNAYPVRSQKNTSSKVVSARALLSRIGMNYSDAVQVFTPRKVGSLLVVDLQEMEEGRVAVEND